MSNRTTTKRSKKPRTAATRVAPPHPAAAAEREKFDNFTQRTLGRRFDTELRPGMVINDCPGERIGVVWHAFNALDLCIYMAQDGKLYSCRIQDVFIEPRPTGEGARHFFPLDAYPPDHARREGLKPLDQITGLFIHLSELLSKLRRVTLPVGCREFLNEYPTSLRNGARAMINELHEFHANLMDEILNNTDLPESDQPLRSAAELRATGAAHAA